MVATSPRIGVGLGSDSQGSVTLFHKYCFPNLYWIHWAITGWSDSAINSNTTVHEKDLDTNEDNSDESEDSDEEF